MEVICIGTLKEAFILKYSYYDKFKKLTPIELQKLIFAIFDYEIEQRSPNFDDNVRLDTIFEFVKDDLDKNRNNYDRRCETSRWNGFLGGRPRNNVVNNDEEENLKKPKKPNNPICNDMTDMNRSDMNNKKENIEKKKGNKCKDNQPKDEKETFGNYKHILLTKKEYESLTRDYGGHAIHIIQFLDSYIEEKGGYKCKSHYLAIKRWVIDAYKDKLQKLAKQKNKEEPVPKWFDKTIESRPMTPDEEKELNRLLEEFNVN